MKISKEDVVKSIELYYDLLSDEIALLESRINTLVGICGVLIVFVSGLLVYILDRVLRLGRHRQIAMAVNMRTQR